MITQRSLLVALLCAAWILPGLIGHDPWKPDEAYTFGVVYEILRGGSWVVPALAGEPFLDKPPLFTSPRRRRPSCSPSRCRCNDARGLRPVSGWRRRSHPGTPRRELYGVRYGAVSALLLLGCFGFVTRARLLLTDIALLAGIAMAYYGLAAALKRPLLGGFWIGTGIGVGFLANGLLAPAVLIAAALLLPALGRDWRTRATPPRAMAAIAAAPVSQSGRSMHYQARLCSSLVGTELHYYFDTGTGARAARCIPSDPAVVRVPVWLLGRCGTLLRARVTGIARPPCAAL